MPTTCFVYGCRSGLRTEALKTGKKWHFFAPPRNDLTLLAKWNHMCFRKDKKLTAASRVCHEHFTDDQIIKGIDIPMFDGTVHHSEYTQWSLKAGAYPCDFSQVEALPQKMWRKEEKKSKRRVLSRMENTCEVESQALSNDETMGNEEDTNDDNEVHVENTSKDIGKQKHFSEDQFEKNRADGWKKLKQNAVPDVFNATQKSTNVKTPCSKNDKTPSSKTDKTPSSKNDKRPSSRKVRCAEPSVQKQEESKEDDRSNVEGKFVPRILRKRTLLPKKVCGDSSPADTPEAGSSTKPSTVSQPVCVSVPVKKERATASVHKTVTSVQQENESNEHNRSNAKRKLVPTIQRMTRSKKLRADSTPLPDENDVNTTCGINLLLEPSTLQQPILVIQPTPLNVPVDTNDKLPLSDVTNIQGTWTCPCCCKKMFPSRRELQAHIEELARSRRCPACNDAFLSLEALAAHLAGECSSPQHLKEIEIELPSKDDDPHLIDTADDGGFDAFVDEDPVRETPILTSTRQGAIPIEFAVNGHDYFATSQEESSCEVPEDPPGKTGRLGHTCCNTLFSTVDAYCNHRRQDHSESEFACTKCPSKSLSQVQLESHLQTHARERPFLCEVCSKSYMKIEHLRKHQVGHSGREFTCKTCGKTFCRPDRLRVHFRTVHLRVPEPCQCETCGATFGSKKNMQNHVYRFHTPSSKSYMKKSKSYYKRKGEKKRIDKPTVPKRRINVFTNEETEERLTNRDFACRMCSNIYREMPLLKQHMAIQHGLGNEQVTCKYCSEVFKTTCAHNYHVRAVHQKRFRCAVCSRRFHFRTHLIHHLAIHKSSPGTFTHSCAACGAAFSRLPILKRHVLEHETDEYKDTTSFTTLDLSQVPERNTNVTCPTCKKVYRNKEALYLHARTHSLPFICETCGDSFPFNYNLQAHMAKAHQPKSEQMETEIEQSDEYADINWFSNAFM